MKNVSIMIKPASSSCNMRCRYCFYADLAAQRENENYGIMSRSTAEAVIDRVLASAEQSCGFVFQGGEPTIAGLDFFRHFVSYVNEKNTRHISVSYALQTNGLLLDEQWAEFLRENRFLIGVSVDGAKDNHDFFRPDAAGKGTYNRVKKNLDLLKKHKVDFNILTVLTSQTARRGASIYEHYRRNGWDYMQFIPCLDPYQEEKGSMRYSLTPEEYGEFLKITFRLWYRDMMAGNGCYIRFFDNILGMAMGVRPESCQQCGSCTAQFVAEADGGIYPCDFYVMEERRMGSIREHSLEDLLESEAALAFNRESALEQEECQKCEFYPWCRGGCRRDRDHNGEIRLNCFCSAYQDFFAYALPGFRELAARLGH